METVDFVLTETEKGAPCIVIKDHRYRKKIVLKSGDIRWCCTVKNCKAMCLSDMKKTKILSIKDVHNHEGYNKQTLDGKVMRATCKRKAVDAMSTQPKKIVRTHLRENSNCDVDVSDVNNTKQAMYRARRKVLPPLPKSVDEVMEQLETLEVIIII